MPALPSTPAVPARPWWRIPLVLELAVVVLIKLAVLLVIRAYWFAVPTVPVDGTARVAERLLGSATPNPVSLEENRDDLRSGR